MRTTALMLAGLLSLTHPPTVNGSPSNSQIQSAPFGALPDGRAVRVYTLRNAHGLEAKIMTYGGIITELKVPDRQGHFDDVVLGYDRLDGYLKSSPYFGALIGRYGNRIAKGRFTLGGATYTLATNDGPNALHGGVVGFDKVLWTVTKAQVEEHGPALTLRYVSHDAEEGYPGTLDVTARYQLTDDDSIRLDYSATTDRETVVNLTQHSYFNLRGNDNRGDVLNHVVTIHAARFTPVDSSLIPTGELRAVANTPFDFQSATPIGARIASSDQQLAFGKGYDHNWVIDGPSGQLRINANVFDPESGRILEVLSDQPGLQFYTGNVLDGTNTGKGGWVYFAHSGFCMEPQHFPDSPNQPQFPSTVLKPGASYHSTIVYRFRHR
jgi:aldose 1-epimerase